MPSENAAARTLGAAALVLVLVCACVGSTERPTPMGRADPQHGGQSATGTGGGGQTGGAGEMGQSGTKGGTEALVPYGLEQRPQNPACRALDRPTGEQGDAFPRMLSQTGCVDPEHPTEPSSGLIAYEVNAPLYSDGAEKQRWLALPDGAVIELLADGDFDLPVGSVLVKLFELGGVAVETRLLMRHADGTWGGYSFAWREDQSDADLLETTVTRQAGDQDWTYPSRENCLECHTEAAGRSLGLEIGQLNRTVSYSLGASNQLRTFEHIGLFADPLPAGELARYPTPADSSEDAGERARAYLHANCSNCHRPGGVSEVTIDLRYETPLEGMRACNVEPSKGNFGLMGSKLVKPGDAALSMLSFRMHTQVSSVRMPPISRTLSDIQGMALIDGWIDGLAGCP